MEQFHNHILLNERILFKFHHEEQKDIIDIITNVIKNIDLDKKTLKVDIIKIIKILLHFDEKKNNLFCCKAHSEFFIENFGIMEPSLNKRLEPIKELLKYLFNEFEEKVKQNDSTIKDSNLYKLFTLLTYDISPCIQKMIIKLFSTVLEHNFEKYIEILDKDQQLLNISLFVLKNSIFEIKEDIIHLIYILLKYENDNKQKNIFICKHILPFYLFADKELIQIITENNENQNEFKFQKYLSQEISNRKINNKIKSE